MTIARSTGRPLLVLAAVMAVCSAATPAEAQQTRPLSLLVKISASPSIGGTAIGASSGTVEGVPVSIDEKSWSDAYSDKAPLFEGGLGVRVHPAAEGLVLFNYGRAGGSPNKITGQAGDVPLNATLDDYEFWGLEGGVRLARATTSGPYATVTAGFRHISEIQARVVGGSLIQRVPVYDSSTKPSVAFGGGMLFGTGTGFSLGFEVAVRYAGAPDVATGRTLVSSSDAGARWSLPFGVVLRFQ